jgi:hypothetical protein
MEATGEQHNPLPCTCEGQVGDTLLWIVVLLVLIVLIDRLIGRRRRRDESEIGGALGASIENGGKR